MAESAKQQLLEALQAASAAGNKAVQEHIQAALLIIEKDSFSAEADLEKSIPNNASDSSSPRLSERVKDVNGDSQEQNEIPKQTVQKEKPSDVGKPSEASEVAKRNAASRSPSPAEDLVSSRDKRKEQEGGHDQTREAVKVRRDESGRSMHRSTSESARRDFGRLMARGGGLYQSLLHSMGIDEANGDSLAACCVREHLPPSRLSSFLSRSGTHLQSALGMGAVSPPGAKDEQKPAAAGTTAQREHRAIFRQHSTLTDSVLTKRSLLGTASNQLSPPSEPGDPAGVRRGIQRSVTGLPSFQRVRHARASPELGGSPPKPGADASTSAPTGAQKVLWRGQVKHIASGSVVDLCDLVCMLPLEVVDQFPKSLFINDLVLRDNVQLSRHILVNCSLQGASAEQRQNLCMMCHMKLTGIIKLQHCEFIVCPVLDSHGDIKVVGFILCS